MCKKHPLTAGRTMKNGPFKNTNGTNKSYFYLFLGVYIGKNTNDDPVIGQTMN